MLNVAQRIQRLMVSVQSPDKRLRASTQGEKYVRFEAKDDLDLSKYTESGLAEQVEAMLNAIVEGKRRGVREAYRVEGREYREVRLHELDADRRRYRAELADLEVVAQSNGKNVRVLVTADRAGYRVKLRPGCLQRLNAKTLIDELNSAHLNAMMAHLDQKSQLKRKHLQVKP